MTISYFENTSHRVFSAPIKTIISKYKRNNSMLLGWIIKYHESICQSWKRRSSFSLSFDYHTIILLVHPNSNINHYELYIHINYHNSNMTHYKSIVFFIHQHTKFELSKDGGTLELLAWLAWLPPTCRFLRCEMVKFWGKIVGQSWKTIEKSGNMWEHLGKIIGKPYENEGYLLMVELSYWVRVVDGLFQFSWVTLQ